MSPNAAISGPAHEAVKISIPIGVTLVGSVNSKPSQREKYAAASVVLPHIEAFSESNPIPDNIKSLEELWDWHKPLLQAEKEWKEKGEESESQN